MLFACIHYYSYWCPQPPPQPPLTSQWDGVCWPWNTWRLFECCSLHATMLLCIIGTTLFCDVATVFCPCFVEYTWYMTCRVRLVSVHSLDLSPAWVDGQDFRMLESSVQYKAELCYVVMQSFSILFLFDRSHARSNQTTILWCQHKLKLSWIVQNGTVFNDIRCWKLKVNEIKIYFWSKLWLNESYKPITRNMFLCAERKKERELGGNLCTAPLCFKLKLFSFMRLSRRLICQGCVTPQKC